jgi:RHS repeat-associated protein
VAQRDYLSFGAITVGRSFENQEYRYNFNGKELDKNTGWQDYGFRDYNPVYKRFDRIDPLSSDYPFYTPYQFAGNKPIQAIDLDGLEEYDTFYSIVDSPSAWSMFGRTSYTHSTFNSLLSSVRTTYKEGDENNSFWKASVYNTKKGNDKLYTTIVQRHAYYNFAQRYLNKNNVESKWFQAAGIVTQWNAVGAAEEYSSLNFGLLHDNTENFLRKGNEFLFTHNMNNLKSLMSGNLSESFIDANGEEMSFKGLSGKALDYALVNFEQTKVQEFTDNYIKNNPDVDMKAVFKEVNGAFGLFAAPTSVKEVINENFEEDKFDFSNYNHRVTLGQKLIDKLYEEPKED